MMMLLLLTATAADGDAMDKCNSNNMRELIKNDDSTLKSRRFLVIFKDVTSSIAAHFELVGARNIHYLSFLVFTYDCRNSNCDR